MLRHEKMRGILLGDLDHSNSYISLNIEKNMTNVDKKCNNEKRHKRNPLTK